MSNPFFDLQNRLKSLIQASPYFAGIASTQVLTEEIGDLDFCVQNQIVNTSGWGVVITTAVGDADERRWEALITNEDLNISVIHSPSMDPAHNALDGTWAIIQAVHGQCIFAAPPPVKRAIDYFSVTGHAKRTDAPEGLHVHEVHVKCGLRLL